MSLCDRTAQQLLAQLTAGEVTSVEIVAAYLERIARLDSR